jgi:uncharacterized membrane protein
VSATEVRLRDVARHEIDQLTEAGHLNAIQREQALAIAGVVPDAAAWQRFLSRLFLLFGVTFLIAAIGYFVAYNWDQLGRFAKMALLEIAVLVPALAAAGFSAEDLRGRAALLAAALATGPLLAYIGQTYQTGADTYELFRAWALLALPWVLVARWRPLWCMWLLIANLSIASYFAEVWLPLAGSLFDAMGLVTHLTANAIFLALLERFGAGLDGGGRSVERLAIALITVASLFLYGYFLFDHRDRAVWQLGFAVIAAAALWYRYRVRRLDMVALALWCFAAIAAAVATLGKLMSEWRAETAGFLLCGMATIGLSALAAMWLRRVSREAEAA